MTKINLSDFTELQVSYTLGFKTFKFNTYIFIINCVQHQHNYSSDKLKFTMNVRKKCFLVFLSVNFIFVGLCEQGSFWQHFRLYANIFQNAKKNISIFSKLLSCKCIFIDLVKCNNPGPHPQFWLSLFTLLHSEEAKPDQSCSLKMMVTNHYFWSLWSLAHSLPRSPPIVSSPPTPELSASHKNRSQPCRY